MADLHPNDIGLATFEDVGDVNNLQTKAKEIVEAINEIKEAGGSLSSLEDQLYVDGENNIILGKGNVVYGSNNLVIGSDNVVAANKARANAEAAAAFNDGYSYAPYSMAVGYSARAYERAIKCTALNNAAKTLTAASGQDLNSLTGKSSWQAAPAVTLEECNEHIQNGTHRNATTSISGFMSSSDKSKLDNATSSYTASRLILRDSYGRAQVQSPSSSYDIANKTYVDSNFVRKNAATTMTARLTAQSNTSYTTKQVRNIVFWTSGTTPPATSYYNEEEESESYLQIYKEE